jgi:hypothetical protein
MYIEIQGKRPPTIVLVAESEQLSSHCSIYKFQSENLRTSSKFVCLCFASRKYCHPLVCIVVHLSHHLSTFPSPNNIVKLLHKTSKHFAKLRNTSQIPKLLRNIPKLLRTSRNPFATFDVSSVEIGESLERIATFL